MNHVPTARSTRITIQRIVAQDQKLQDGREIPAIFFRGLI